MSITITAKNSEYSFETGRVGFFNLRKTIAYAYDEEFGDLYSQLIRFRTKEEYALFVNAANDILSEPRFKDKDREILAFLFKNDTSDKVDYKTCGKLYELIKDNEYVNEKFTYRGRSNGSDYRKFKEFLKECYSHRRNMFWA